jgi:YD repeat-containing protein
LATAEAWFPHYVLQLSPIGRTVAAQDRALGKLGRLALAGGITFLVVVFGGPVSSGAIFLLLPPGSQAAPYELPDSYQPLHKGFVELSMGIYTRENEDLVLTGTPPIVLRRTYMQTWRSDKQFGLKTTHNGEEYLIGDPQQFQWAALVTAAGNHIRFERTSPGTSFINAMFEHRTTPGEFLGASLGWTGFGWTMRLRDGSQSSFQPCGPRSPKLCSLVHTRDAAGETVTYKRDDVGKLLRMEASSNRWIAFDYDDRDRIVRAYDSGERAVRYAYDDRGRLTQVNTFDGQTMTYTYTERDEMRTVVEPHTSLENTYDSYGRCIRQVNRFPGDPKPLVFEFEYEGEGFDVTETTSKRSDGTWSRHTFDANRRKTSEAWGAAGQQTATLTYERDAVSGVVIGLTLTCPDRAGRETPHSSRVQPGHEEWVKWDLFQTHCTWSDWIKDRHARRLDRAAQ